MGIDNSEQVMTGAGVTYQCPRCQGGIDKGKDYWRCTSCGREFEVRRGIPILDVGNEPAEGVTGAAERDVEHQPVWTKSVFFNNRLAAVEKEGLE